MSHGQTKPTRAMEHNLNEFKSSYVLCHGCVGVIFLLLCLARLNGFVSLHLEFFSLKQCPHALQTTSTVYS